MNPEYQYSRSDTKRGNYYSSADNIAERDRRFPLHTSRSLLLDFPKYLTFYFADTTEHCCDPDIAASNRTNHKNGV